MLRQEFPGHSYVALDSAPIRVRARRDPPGFLARFRGPAIVDDLHRAPELAQYLATPGFSAPLILATSRRLQLPLKTLDLYAPTSAERQQRPPLPLAVLGRFVPSLVPVPPPAPWPTQRNFIECDLRDLVSVHDADRFESFLQAAQLRSGQPLDQQALANECGLSHRTVARWLSILETCFLTLRLPPADMDFGRRIVRRPKLHFLESDAFESQAVSELFRNAKHAGEVPDLRYWRDSNGLEISLVVQSAGESAMPVNIAPAPAPADVVRLKRWMKLAGVSQAALIGKSYAPARTGGVLRYSIEQL
jgi:hypothetical protein